MNTMLLSSVQGVQVYGLHLVSQKQGLIPPVLPNCFRREATLLLHKAESTQRLGILPDSTTNVRNMTEVRLEP